MPRIRFLQFALEDLMQRLGIVRILDKDKRDFINNHVESLPQIASTEQMREASRLILGRTKGE